MCLSKPKAPPPVSPPPMMLPESADENVARMKVRERQRAASAFGRQSTILASAFGAASTAPPTSQATTLLGR